MRLHDDLLKVVGLGCEKRKLGRSKIFLKGRKGRSTHFEDSSWKYQRDIFFLLASKLLLSFDKKTLASLVGICIK